MSMVDASSMVSNASIGGSFFGICAKMFIKLLLLKRENIKSRLKYSCCAFDDTITCDVMS